MKIFIKNREAMITLKELIDTADTQVKKEKILGMSSDLPAIWIAENAPKEKI